MENEYILEEIASFCILLIPCKLRLPAIISFQFIKNE